MVEKSRLSLRITKILHEALEKEASEKGISVNALISIKLSELKKEELLIRKGVEK